jgi:anti-sigma factor (TIGR02949 family)
MSKDKAIEDIDCQDAIAQLYSYIDGEMDDHEAVEKLEHHLGHCHSCFTRSEVERALNKRMRESGKRQAPDALQNRLREMIEKF